MAAFSRTVGGEAVGSCRGALRSSLRLTPLPLIRRHAARSAPPSLPGAVGSCAIAKRPAPRARATDCAHWDCGHSCQAAAAGSCLVALLLRVVASLYGSRPSRLHADPYFASLANVKREPSTHPISKLEFERRKLAKDDVR